MTFERGNLLYPRLEPSAARQLCAERATLPLPDLELLGTVAHPDAAPAPTGGHPVEDSRLLDLQGRIRAVAAEAGYPELLKGAQAFDRPCGQELFTTMGIVTADAADEGVWSYMSLVLVPEIGPWRFPDRAEERILGKPRNVFRRLWWRAWALGENLDAAPGGCTPLGEDEFVQIMERPSLGGNPRTARAIRDALWRAEAGTMAVARSELMRQVTRRVRAARSHLALDVLSDTQLRELLDQLITLAHLDLTGKTLALAQLESSDPVRSSGADDPGISIAAEPVLADTLTEVAGDSERPPIAESDVSLEDRVQILTLAYAARHNLVSKSELRDLRESLPGWLALYSDEVLHKAIDQSSTLGGIEPAAERIHARLEQLRDPSKRRGRRPAHASARNEPIFVVYKGHRVEAELARDTDSVTITSGALAQSTYASPSSAARAVVALISPDVNPERNGWDFWLVSATGAAIQSIRRKS